MTSEAAMWRNISERVEREKAEALSRVAALADDFAADDSYPHPGAEVAEQIRAALAGSLDTRGARTEEKA